MLSLNSFGSVANRNSRLWSYLRRVQEAIDSKTNWNLLSTQFLASLRAISDCTDAAVPIDLKQSFVFFVNNRNAMVMSVEFQLENRSTDASPMLIQSNRSWNQLSFESKPTQSNRQQLSDFYCICNLPHNFTKFAKRKQSSGELVSSE